MAYATYTTEALVCGTFDRNTADRSYQLFTRELGMVYASARSVRLEKSRQRYALTDFSLVRVSLVRGKAGWKIGSIEALANFYHQAHDQSARGSVRDLVRTVRRFVVGEEPQPELYAYVVAGLRLLAAEQAERAVLTAALTARTLSYLGYIPVEKLPAGLGGPEVELPARLTRADLVVLQRLITHAETASHL